MRLRTFSFMFAAVAVATSALAWQQSRSHSITNNWGDQKYSYAIMSGDNTHCFGNWDSDDLERLKTGKGDRLIVRKDGKTYEITDKQTLASAKKAIQPVIELGRKQGELGRQQGELGRKQGELGRQQGELGRLQGEIARLSSSRDASSAEVNRKQGELGRKQGELGKKQGELGRHQGELGRKQGELGKQQGIASKKANGEIEKLIDSALDKGLARAI